MFYNVFCIYNGNGTGTASATGSGGGGGGGSGIIISRGCFLCQSKTNFTIS